MAASLALAQFFDCLRIYRVTGTCGKEDTYTLSKVTGQEKKSPAMAHHILKKMDVAEFILHEAALVDDSFFKNKECGMFRTPRAIANQFSASGEKGLLAAFRNGDPT